MSETNQPRQCRNFQMHTTLISTIFIFWKVFLPMPFYFQLCKIRCFFTAKRNGDTGTGAPGAPPSIHV